MKLNKILMAFAAMAMVGCSSDDLMDFSANQAPEDSRLIQLDDNFAIAGVGEGDAITRTHWDNAGGKLVNKFLPILTGAYAADEVLANKVEKTNQAVGLCWLGQTPGAEVYTNYQFYHFGWLKQGASKAILECDKLTNGAWYDEIKFSAAGGAADAEPATGDFAFVDPATKDFAITALDYNSGVYKTDNKSIFGGDYVVYYPFDEAFNKVGTIPAKAVTSFDAASNDYRALYLGNATFRYSNKVTIEGGAKASGFSLHNLSALVNLQVKGTSGGNIDKIVLWSKKEQLLEQANLAADKILAGKTGKDLYAETKGTKTIVASLATPDAAYTGHAVNTYITALPTTVEDLVAYVHRADGKWAKITTLGKVEFEPNTGKVVTINVKNSDFETQFIAVDAASFQTALTEAAGLNATIEVIGDITLDTTPFVINEPGITITGDKIIVPEDITLDVKVKEMKSDIDVLGKSCCSGAQGGRLYINGGKFSNITMVPAEATVTAANYDTYNPYVSYKANATIAEGKTFDAQAGNVEVNKAVAHKGNINIAEGVTLKVNDPDGDLNFMGSTVVNNGTIEVMRDAKFDITDKDGNASAEDGKNMTNNGTFIHNVDAQVGTAVQLMNQNGEYRCRVNKQIKLDDAYQKWTACSVIEIIEAGQIYDLGVAEKNINYQHNGKYIDIEVNTTSATTFNNPADGSGNGDEKNIQVGNLTVMQSGLYVPFTTGNGKRELTVNGDMTVSATASLYSSKKITVKENLIVDNGAELKYWGKKKNEGGLAVEKDIKVSGATFNAFVDKVDALDITCANFTLAGAATAVFGNRTEGDTKNLTVSGTITNPEGCTFDIKPANQEGASILATITCTKLMVGGAFPGGKPQVVAK